MKKFIMKLYWINPILSNTNKEKIYYFIKKTISGKKEQKRNKSEDFGKRYINQILSIPNMKFVNKYVKLNEVPFKRKTSDPKLIAYYLPQFYPFKENDEWWGKGTTEWNNVSKAVPQFLGQYQPRLPGELGYYDLRIKENIVRQVELAKLYGIYAFCYYYYWFDGKRLLDKPLDLFLESKDIDFQFCLCWANESWTKRFDGVSGEIIMKQSSTAESYKAFITSLEKYIIDERYLTIAGKKVLIIYKPSLIPDIKKILEYWRQYCRNNSLGDLYIIGVKEGEYNKDLLEAGFDAVSEFHPGTIIGECTEITDKMKYATENFYGKVFDYKDIITNKKYFNYDYSKLYRSVMPMWDNTARRNNKGIVFHNASPSLYEQWLLDIIKNTNNRKDLDDNIIFINAWNEWAEGAYLEPDGCYGYAFLQSTRNAMEKSRYGYNMEDKFK